MIIYNVTVKTEAAIAETWLDWMKKVHIPEILATGCFFDYKICRLLELDDSDGPTFAVQYHANTYADYKKYLQIHAPELRKATLEKWGESIIAFRSVMEIVQ